MHVIKWYIIGFLIWSHLESILVYNTVHCLHQIKLHIIIKTAFIVPTIVDMMRL